MRLRPSGRSGPLATHIDGFADYQQNEAWTWEHMALTRARVVSASTPFAARVEALIRAVLHRPRDAEMVAADVVEMRKAIATEKGDSERWNLKYVAGGLIDIEFIAQYLQLVHAATTPDILDTSTARVLEKAWRLGVLSTEEAEVLRPAMRLYDDLTQILRLCLSGPFDPGAAASRPDMDYWRAPPTCPILPRSMLFSARPRTRCVRASIASSAYRLERRPHASNVLRLDQRANVGGHLPLSSAGMFGARDFPSACTQSLQFEFHQLDAG